MIETWAANWLWIALSLHVLHRKISLSICRNCHARNHNKACYHPGGYPQLSRREACLDDRSSLSSDRARGTVEWLVSALKVSLAAFNINLRLNIIFVCKSLKVVCGYWLLFCWLGWLLSLYILGKWLSWVWKNILCIILVILKSSKWTFLAGVGG